MEYHSQRLCRINEQGNVFYRQEEVDSPEREKACAKATDIAGTVLEYMNHLEHAPTLKAAGLSEPYQSLAEFNGTVLAGRLTEKGAKFVTWDWDFNHAGLNHGHYYEGDYVGAKRDFAIRSARYLMNASLQLSSSLRSINRVPTSVSAVLSQRNRSRP